MQNLCQEKEFDFIGAFILYISYIAVYHTEGFLLFQHALHKSILTILNPDWLKANVSVNLEQIPSPPYTTDTFITVIKVNLPFIIIICFIFLALQIPKEVTYEKQMKLKVTHCI